MTTFTKEQYNNHFNHLECRFPNAQFTISCFSIEDGVDFDSKILCDDDCIIYKDAFIGCRYTDAFIDFQDTFRDFFLITKKEGNQHIYYADVIDELIKQGFQRNECDHHFLENIKLEGKSRNINSIPVYSSFWGS